MNKNGEKNGIALHFNGVVQLVDSEKITKFENGGVDFDPGDSAGTIALLKTNPDDGESYFIRDFNLRSLKEANNSIFKIVSQPDDVVPEFTNEKAQETEAGAYKIDWQTYKKILAKTTDFITEDRVGFPSQTLEISGA